VGLAYLGLGLVAQAYPGGGASWLWLVAVVGVITLGELWILPVGLGLFGRLAPAGLAATMIAAWYLAGFAGNLLSGTLGALLTTLGASAFFALAGGVAGVAGLALLGLNHWTARRGTAPT
jgi:POT family proton-dependent oligopeptide transporter